MGNRANFDFKAYLLDKRRIVDGALDGYFPKVDGLTADLINAMRYSLFAGGKRLRPILCIAGAEMVGGQGRDLLPVACALEMIHTYSLIHDDLPLMDDDDLRRGKPTNHKVFGDAIALLAGDGLLTEAFSLMTSPHATREIPPDRLLEAIQLISVAAGHGGMVGGQVVDMQWEGKRRILKR
jgi:geranylgeranyl diphosphate synthase type II